MANTENTFDLQDPTFEAKLLQEVGGLNGQDWLNYRYPGYEDAAERWAYVDDHYSGNVLLDDRIADYLIQRKRAEHNESFTERKKIASYTPHLATVIDSLVGMMEAVNSDIDRQWQPDDATEGLGNPDERGDPAWRIWNDANGSGTNYVAFWQRFETELVKFQECYVLVEGIRKSEGRTTQQPRLRIIVPDMVVNRMHDSAGRMTHCLLMHKADSRKTIQDSPVLVDRYTLYAPEGWTTWEKQTDRNKKTQTIQVDAGTYAYYDGPQRNNRVLPIQRFRLPMSRHVAWLGARMCNRIFNVESERQMATRFGNIARFAIVGNKQQFDAIVNNVDRGSTVMQHWPDQQQPHYYIVPPTAPAEIASEQLKEYVDNFYAVMFSQFGDAARERTATEIRQEARSGVEAFLTLLSDTADEGENWALMMLEQTEFPDKPALWGQARVRRSKNFQVVNSEAQIARKRDTYFMGEPVPVGETGRIEVALQIAEYDGIAVDEDEIEREVREGANRTAIDQGAREAFGLG